MSEVEQMARKYIEGSGGLLDLYRYELAIPLYAPAEVEGAAWLVKCLIQPSNRGGPGRAGSTIGLTEERVITIEEMKAKYPNPVMVGRYSVGTYCVGGAVCHEANVHGADFPSVSGFPGDLTLARALAKLNPHLPGRGLRRRASGIIANNDRGRFDLAWAAVGRALSYRKPVP